MRDQIRNLIGAALLILAIGVPSCLAVTQESEAAVAGHAAPATR